MALKLTNAAHEQPTLWVYGDIGEVFGGISPDEVRLALAEVPDREDITVRINSDGGSFADSIAIYSLIARRKGAAHVIVDSSAHSGGSIIAQAGRTIHMTQGSWMMIHEAQGRMEGQADDFRAAAERLDALNDQLVQVYMPRWKGSEKELRDALHSETWLRDTAAVEFGLADVVDSDLAVAAHFDNKFKYKNVPDVLAVKNPGDTSIASLERAGKVLESLFSDAA